MLLLEYSQAHRWQEGTCPGAWGPGSPSQAHMLPLEPSCLSRPAQSGHPGACLHTARDAHVWTQHAACGTRTQGPQAPGATCCCLNCKHLCFPQGPRSSTRRICSGHGGPVRCYVSRLEGHTEASISSNLTFMALSAPLREWYRPDEVQPQLSHVSHFLSCKLGRNLSYIPSCAVHWLCPCYIT